MVRFIDDCSMPNVKANIDVSHLVLADTSPSELEKLKGKATHVHISDFMHHSLMVILPLWNVFVDGITTSKEGEIDESFVSVQTQEQMMVFNGKYPKNAVSPNTPLP